MRQDIPIRTDDLTNPQTADLLQLHLADMLANSPPGAVQALDLSGLRDPRVTVFSAWSEDGRIAGLGALKLLKETGQGEVKSMRTHPDFLRQGVAKALLKHIVSVARQRGLHRLSIETGRGTAFQGALRMYRDFGFVEGSVYGGYAENGFSIYLHLDL